LWSSRKSIYVQFTQAKSAQRWEPTYEYMSMSDCVYPHQIKPFARSHPFFLWPILVWTHSRIGKDSYFFLFFYFGPKLLGLGLSLETFDTAKFFDENQDFPPNTCTQSTGKLGPQRFFLKLREMEMSLEKEKPVKMSCLEGIRGINAVFQSCELEDSHSRIIMKSTTFLHPATADGAPRPRVTYEALAPVKIKCLCCVVCLPGFVCPNLSDLSYKTSHPHFSPQHKRNY